ncbi:hypothetical protein Tco_0819637 [Tanacetum coccineum]|uniref:Xylulose kinase-1 n=1 Tax=Tanacetum coccineum TaxID=301880 RepID=A0ABQ5AB30_9ASTR
MANLEFCDKHNMVAYLKKPTGSEGFQEIVDFLNGSHIRYALTKNPTIYVSLIKKFWQTTTIRTVDNGEQEITTTVDAEEGKGSGHPSEPQLPSSTTQPTHEEPIPNVAVYEEWDDNVERATTTATSLDAEQASSNNNKTQSTAIPNVPLPQGISAGGSTRCQEAMRGSIAQTRSERVPTSPYDSPFLRVHTLGSDEGSMTLQELMVLCITLSKKVESLEADLKQTKKVYGATYTKLIMKVKRGFFQTGRMIEEMDQDAGVTLVTPTQGEDQPEDYIGSGGISTASRLFSTAEESVSTAEQDRLGHEAVVRLQEELDEEERQRMDRVHEAAQSFTEEEWENIKARVEADKELTQRLQAEERNKGRPSELAARSSQATIIDSAEVGSSKRGAEAELDHEGSKRQKTNETSGSVQEQPEEEEKEMSNIQSLIRRFTLKNLENIRRSSGLCPWKSILAERHERSPRPERSHGSQVQLRPLG